MRAQLTDKRTGITIHAEWEGGPYIDLGTRPGRAAEVINVWDYETDTARVPYTRQGLRAALHEWLDDYRAEDGPGEDSFAHDVAYWDQV